MKIVTIIVRVLIGLFLLFASISYFLKLTPEPVTTGDFKAFQLGLVVSKPKLNKKYQWFVPMVSILQSSY